MSGKKRIDKFQPKGYSWSHRAKLEGLRPVLNPSDKRGKNNSFIDIMQKMAILKYCHFSCKDIVLDFGCGIGRLTKWLAPSVQYIVGIDITKEMLYKAKLSCKLSNVDFVLDDGSNLCFRRNSFDIILSVGVLQCMYVGGGITLINNVIEQMLNCLKDKGIICMIEQLPIKQLERASFIRKGRVKCIVSHPLLTRSPFFHLLVKVLPSKFIPLLAKIAFILSRMPHFPKGVLLIGKKYIDHICVLQKKHS